VSHIHIDFAPRTLRRALARTSAATWFAGCAGLALCIGVTLTALDLTAQYKARALQLQRALETQKERSLPQPAPKKPSLSEVQAHAINGAIAQLNLPWRELFHAIESATPATIALLSLEPDARKQRIHLVAEAKTSDAMIAYIENLKREAFLDNVVLTRHEINEQDPNHPLRFQVQAQWTPNQP